MSVDPAVYHVPVLASEVIELLQPAPEKVIVDGTLGGGGHTELMLRAGARVIGFDQDLEAIAQATERLHNFTTFTTMPRNFAELDSGLDDLEIGEIDGLLLDLGVSSHQLDVAERGFSFRAAAPLDMRMNTRDGQSAQELVAEASEGELTTILRDYGEERYAHAIARRIVQERKRAPILTTDRLADVVAGSVPPAYRHGRIHPATRTFQALRIAVNDELGVLETVLETAWKRLKRGGRLAVISYHSLEDRIVKRHFQALLPHCTCPPQSPICVCGNVGYLRLVTRKPVVPGEEELKLNPRSRSAKLRVAERI